MATLGMTNEQFWNATPRVLIAQWNHHNRPPDRPLTPDEITARMEGGAR